MQNLRIIEDQSEPVEDDELEMDVDEDAEQEDADGDPDDVDVVGHDDEGIVDDKDVVEEDIEDELIDVRTSYALYNGSIDMPVGCLGCRRVFPSTSSVFLAFAAPTQDQAKAPSARRHSNSCPSEGCSCRRAGFVTAPSIPALFSEPVPR